MPRPARVAVIGAGFGGLAAAIRLQAQGLSTVLFEARDKLGGRAYVYEEAGFTFDAGPTVITAPHVIDELFELAGKRRDSYIDLLPVEPYYRLLWEDGTRIEYQGGEKLIEQIEQKWPDDTDGYRRFIDYAGRVFQKGYVNLASEPFLRFTDMLRVAPDLIRLRADRSVYSTVSRFVHDEHLRQALSFHTLLVGGNPFETSAIYTLIHYLEREWGVYFPRGGTGALVKALGALLCELGGEIRLNSPVLQARMVTTEGRPVHRVVTREAGEEVFDAVVSNADVHHTYTKIYKLQPEADGMRRFLERAHWSMSLFVLYFGATRNWDMAHHTVIFGSRYKELLREIFHGGSLPDDFSLYLHAPSVTDPSMSPPGSGSYYVLSPVPHLGNADIDWDQVAPSYADRILAALERWMPDLRRHLVVRRWLTPLDFRDQLQAPFGSAFSVAPELTQSAWFRPHNRDPRIPRLYLVGAGTHPGAGVPGVMNSAKATAKLVLQDLGRCS